MKKIIVIVGAIIISILLYRKEDLIIIPNESIRIRIIARSNKIEDLIAKKNLKSKVEKEVYDLLKDSTNVKEARNKLLINMNNIDKIISKNHQGQYKLDYGINYFPKKIYRGVLYEAGNYESLVITLGEGTGENWWCVLFPPLCLFEENNNTSDVEYQLYVKELLKN